MIALASFRPASCVRRAEGPLESRGRSMWVLHYQPSIVSAVPGIDPMHEQDPYVMLADVALRVVTRCEASSAWHLHESVARTIVGLQSI